MLSVTNLCKAFQTGRNSDPVLAVDNVSLQVEKGELFTFLGPSGCGKTTTLRSIAGLETPDSGRIEVDGRTLYCSEENVSVAANDRRLGMVFQSYAIWPHMTVFQNVAFPLRHGSRSNRVSRSDLAQRVRSALEMVELGGLEDRPSTNLSGGQQQRLALARALACGSSLLLLDEPLSNLDAKLRELMRFELRRMQRRYELTAVYVTHDQTEALGMSTRIAVMHRGQVEQVGTPKEIYDHPATRFVAGFIGTSNFFDGTVAEWDAANNRALVDVGIACAWGRARSAMPVGTRVTFAARPERISIREDTGGDLESKGQVRGQVATQQFLGESIDYLIRIEGSDVEVRVRSAPHINLPYATPVVIEFDSVMSHVLPFAEAEADEKIEVPA